MHDLVNCWWGLAAARQIADHNAPSESQVELPTRHHSKPKTFEDEGSHCIHPTAAVVAGAAASKRRKLGRIPDQARWDEQFQRLVEYKKMHDTTHVSPNNSSLSQWVRNQWSSYKKGKLSQHRVQQLNSLGFQWDYKKERMGKERLDLLNKIGFAWKGTYPFHFEQSVDGVFIEGRANNNSNK